MKLVPQMAATKASMLGSHWVACWVLRRAVKKDFHLAGSLAVSKALMKVAWTAARSASLLAVCSEKMSADQMVLQLAASWEHRWADQKASTMAAPKGPTTVENLGRWLVALKAAHSARVTAEKWAVMTGPMTAAM